MPQTDNKQLFHEKSFLTLSLLVFLFFAFTTFPHQSHSSDQVKTIVVFFSLDVNLPAYSGFLKGLNQQFSESEGQSYNIIIEYININRYTSQEAIENIINLYNEKYQAVDIDVLITFGPGTFSFLRMNDFKAINSLPIINIDIESNMPEVDISDEKILHINIRTDYEKTIKTAIDLFPENKEVYIISGSSPADHYFARLTKQATEAFSKTHKFIFCSGITLDSTLIIVRTIPKNSLVLVTSYIEDIKGIPYSTSVVENIITDNCQAPLFTLGDEFLGAGAIGGYVYSFSALGNHIGIITDEILNGKPVKEIAVNEKSFNRNMYDWQQLKKWNLLDSKALSRDSEFYNKEEKFVEKYKWYIVGVLFFVISQTILILHLFRLNKNQKKMARQREENEILYRELVREDRLSRMSELTASLSHELNQPLTAILYNAQAGKRFLESGKLDNNQAAEIFNNIIEDDKRAGSLISSIRSLMKLETREKEEVEVNSLIEQTIRLFYSETIARHIDINFNARSKPILVHGDKIQLQQVILNLLFNATFSMENNQTEIKQIAISQQIKNGYVTISIRDTGPGINDSIKKSLFKAFVSSGTRGMGIGLAVSRSIIENHQGTISAANHPEGGAEFSFTLKLINNERQE